MAIQNPIGGFVNQALNPMVGNTMFGEMVPRNQPPATMSPATQPMIGGGVAGPVQSMPQMATPSVQPVTGGTLPLATNVDASGRPMTGVGSGQGMMDFFNQYRTTTHQTPRGAMTGAEIEELAKTDPYWANYQQQLGQDVFGGLQEMGQTTYTTDVGDLTGRQIRERTLANPEGGLQAQIDKYGFNFDPATDPTGMGLNLGPLDPEGNQLYGLTGATEAITSGTGSALDMIKQAYEEATGAVTDTSLRTRGDIYQALEGGREGLEEFGGGAEAQNLQAALSGALGPEAQAEAYANYQASPGFQYSLDEAERALRRNEAATGGLGGGRLKQELMKQAIGMTSQEFGGMFDRLGDVAGRGMEGAKALGGLAQTGAGLYGDVGMTEGTVLADLLSGRGRAGGELAAQAGRDVGEFRYRAGEDVAGAVTDTTSELARLINEQGGDLSGIVGDTGRTLADLLLSAGDLDAESKEELARLFMNAQLGMGSEAAESLSRAGVARGEGTRGAAEQARTGAGELFDFGSSVGDIIKAF